MEKKSFSKHHFWILLALAVVLIPVVIGGAAFGVGGAAREERKKIEADIDKLAKAQPKGSEYIAKLGVQKEELAKRRNEVWKKAYEDQTGLIKWPDRLSPLDVRYFGDDIPQDQLTILRDDHAALLGEYEKFAEIIKPTRFLNNNWRVVGYVPEPWHKQPSPEEAWLTLEDLCVRREILKDIQAINRFLSRFLAEPGSPPVPPNPMAYNEDTKEELAKAQAEYTAQKARYDQLKPQVEKELNDFFKPKSGENVGRFISEYWQLDLAVRRDESKAGRHIFRGRITNRSVRRQNIDKVEFKVFFQNPDDPATQPAILKLNHEYLASGETFEFGEITSVFTAPTLKMLAVEQNLDQKFAPVKRVDRLVLSYPSHRYAQQPLQMTKFSQKEVEAAAAGGAGGLPGGPGLPGAAPGGPPVGIAGGGPDAPGGPGGAVVNTNWTQNGLPRMRYLHMTEQVRRMPIGVVLVVDQMHVQDVVRAFANSRLRFQNTQFHWQRFHGSLGFENQMAGAGVPGGGEPGMDRRRGMDDDRPRGGAAPGGPPGGLLGDRFSAGTGRPPAGGGPSGALPGGPPGGAPGGMLWNQQQTFEEGTGNLVELSVYGIASIYERFPPKPAPADAGTTPGAAPGGAPAAPTGEAPPPPPAPAGGTNPPPAAPTPPMPPAGTNPPPATPPAPPAGTNPAPPAGNTPPPTPPTPPAPPGNNPPPGNPMQ